MTTALTITIRGDEEKQWRCPYCNQRLADGDFPDGPVTIKCRRCKRTVTFLRVKPVK